ncbi:hypothetical protein BH11ARM2_BH11ARM2_33510 [soil metagenome]
MTARQVIDHQLALNEAQFRKLLEGLDDAALDFRTHPTAMSLREQLEHMCLTYNAVIAEARGEEPIWESPSGAGKSFSELLFEKFERRDNALALFSGKEDEGTLQTLNGWIVLHDNYHIGQISLLRHAFDPMWDSMVLYG